MGIPSAPIERKCQREPKERGDSLVVLFEDPHVAGYSDFNKPSLSSRPRSFLFSIENPKVGIGAGKGSHPLRRQPVNNISLVGADEYWIFGWSPRSMDRHMRRPKMAGQFWGHFEQPRGVRSRGVCLLKFELLTVAPTLPRSVFAPLPIQ
jgi:hypothetical protein